MACRALAFDAPFDILYGCTVLEQASGLPHSRRMELLQVICRMYESELNVGLQSDWDGGVTLWLGGPHGQLAGPILARRTFAIDELDTTAAWLEG